MSNPGSQNIQPGARFVTYGNSKSPRYLKNILRLIKNHVCRRIYCTIDQKLCTKVVKVEEKALQLRRIVWYR